MKTADFENNRYSQKKSGTNIYIVFEILNNSDKKLLPVEFFNEDIETKNENSWNCMY